jgi:hypothetical protein
VACVYLIPGGTRTVRCTNSPFGCDLTTVSAFLFCHRLSAPQVPQELGTLSNSSTGAYSQAPHSYATNVASTLSSYGSLVYFIPRGILAGV